MNPPANISGYATSVSFDLRVSRGGSLTARRWEPVGTAMGGIAIVHGLGEHSGRYAHVADRFASEGYFVAAHDQVGHGLNHGRRGHARSYQWLLDDIDQLLSVLRATVGGNAPIFLYGQSLGGNLVLNHALQRHADLTGVIASSPLLLPTTPPPTWKFLLGRSLRFLWPSFRFKTGIKASDLSSDPASMTAFQADALVHDRVSARLAVEMFVAGRWSLAHAADLRTPTLLLHGTADRVTSCDASAAFAAAAGDPPCTLRTWPGLLHELHWERQRDEVLGCILNWIRNTA